MGKDKLELDDLYDASLVPDDLSGNTKIAKKAIEHVVATFERYRDDRKFQRGGKEVDLPREWDENYRIYKAIYLARDHNYKG